jgi:6-pyruvoyltetrahydropterin/6-carboxytetrahydropterin synthase
MYRISKRLEIAGSHNLSLDYESKCEYLHGHNWIIQIYVEAEKLDNNGMVLDFTRIKKEIHDFLDHKYLNEIFDFNPTAENIAYWIAHKVSDIREGAACYKVSVQESEGNIAVWER